MHKERGERRDFLPEFVSFLDTAGAGQIVLEEGYGSGMDIVPDEYLRASPRARFATYAECLAQDLVVVVRCPEDVSLRMLRSGSVLVSMLHFASRPERAVLLADRGVRAVGLDAIVDDNGRRLVENLEAVAWNGVRAAFRELARLHPMFAHPSRRPLRVTCLGSGAVGGRAVHAATRYGDPGLREDLVSRNVPGVEVTVVDFDLTWHEDYMLTRLERTDLLIDATQRRDHARPVVPNGWLAALPADAVILDLSADSYDFTVEPPRVKGIEGVPHGDLDQYVFRPDDPAYDRIDPRVPTTNRRTALSCYAWPGLRPRDCMRTYGAQVEPLLSLVLTKPIESWDSEHGTYEERAATRGELSRWMPARTG